MSFPSDIRGIYQSEREVEDPKASISAKVVVVAYVKKDVVLFRGPSSDPEVKLTTDQVHSNRALGSDATVTISGSEKFGTGAAQPASLNFKRGATVKMEDGTEEPQFSFKTPLPAFGTRAKTWRFTKTGRQDRAGGAEWYTPSPKKPVVKPITDPPVSPIRQPDLSDSDSDSDNDKGTSNAQLIVIAVIMVLAAALLVRVT